MWRSHNNLKKFTLPYRFNKASKKFVSFYSYNLGLYVNLQDVFTSLGHYVNSSSPLERCGLFSDFGDEIAGDRGGVHDAGDEIGGAARVSATMNPFWIRTSW